jgi:hypothetical protein
MSFTYLAFIVDPSVARGAGQLVGWVKVDLGMASLAANLYLGFCRWLG